MTLAKNKFGQDDRIGNWPPPLRTLFELWVSVYQIELNYKIIFLVQCYIFVYIYL